MTRKTKKTVAIAVTLALAAMLTMAMSVTIFAADNPTNTGSITIEKTLVVSNPDLTSVDGPGLTMNYAIAPVAPAANNGGTTITDNADPAHTATVNQGVADGITLSASSISWPIGTAVDASAAGADNTKSITATVDLTKFQHAGIYRYQLTETVGTDTSATGAEGEIRYIDVYIENGNDGLVCSGVVMHDGSTQNGKPANKATFSDEEFETVNIELEKEVTGNMGDKTHQFPFAGTVSDNSRFFYAKKNEAPTASDATVTAFPSNVTLAHTEKYYISGLSHEAAVAYTETNNTQDTYQVSITGGTASAASAVTAGNTKAMASTDVDNAGSVKFTNAMDQVNPTGVVMRYGPYLIMLLAALGFALIIRNRRRADSAQ